MSFSAVLFDLDGTIIDSEGNYFEADRAFLAEYGVDFSDEVRAEMVGRGSREMIAWLQSEHGVRESTEKLLMRKDELYLRIARSNTDLFPEMHKFIQELSERNIPMAVASGSSRQIIQEMLETFKLREYFPAVVSSDEVSRGKPYPDVFLEAARRLNVAPASCLVIEDSQYGVEAAIRAGMATVAIPTVITEPLQESFTRADFLCRNGMEDFSAEALIMWMDGDACCLKKR